MSTLQRSTTHCVHFARTSASSEFLEADVEAARRVGVKFAYWNYCHGGKESESLANPLAIALGLEHVPYGNRRPWTQFLDDLITLAHRNDGLVIIIDRADILITEKPHEMFDCVEAFLIQFHHWYDQKKPCHLYFQMVKDDYLTNLFAR